MSEVVYKDIPGFPGYRVGNDGSVWTPWSIGRKHSLKHVLRQLPQYRNNYGYLTVTVHNGRNNVQKSVHRLVLKAFVGCCPSGHNAAHYDGNKMNNSLGNLRWATIQENHDDKKRHGKVPNIITCKNPFLLRIVPPESETPDV